jgi:recombinational DNA repair protein (RecF pathway)
MTCCCDCHRRLDPDLDDFQDLGDGRSLCDNCIDGMRAALRLRDQLHWLHTERQDKQKPNRNFNPFRSMQ